MGFLNGWKMKKLSTNPKSAVAGLNPSGTHSQAMPEQNLVEPVKTAETQMTKFNGLKRRLAKDRNLFKESKD